MTELLWQIVTSLVFIIVTAAVILKVYLQFTAGKCTSKTDLTGKVALVTGANTGIGYYTALDFARRNARVILACRDLKKGQVAVSKIQEATGNNNVVVMKLDVSLMKSVREFAQQFIDQESRVNILVNNAGVAGLPKTLTEEGFEVTVATNHFGHFLLTDLLLDLLKKSAPSRIVNVSSMVHAWCKNMDFDNLKAEKSYDIQKFYQTSKLCNVLFTRELARRLEGTGVSCYCVHPGVVQTEIWRHLPTPHDFLLSVPKFAFFKTSEEGAQTSIYCAVSEEVEGVSGKYYVDCKEAEDQASDQSRDMGLAKKLWEVSEKYTGLAE